jgi:hypothetical protein
MTFPKNGVHGLLVKALATEASSAKLLHEVKFLLSRRAGADYELQHGLTYSGTTDADACLITAQEAFGKALPQIDNAALDGIAEALERLTADRERRTHAAGL